ncbi:MAG: hypothetical protein Q8J97_01005, partial [Flavobacteriaceae bacterium]|nr:hypothetical protein [Flavobacteriaceae bacterium]
TVLDVAICRSPPDAELQQLLLMYGARLGRDLDLGNRELLIHDERRGRSQLVHRESESLSKLLGWHASRVEEIEIWERFARRQARLIEKEETRRDAMAREQAANFSAMVWARETEQTSLRKMLHVMLEDASATKIQTKWRTVLSKRVLNMRRAHSMQRKRAATNIQRVFRGKLARDQFRELREKQLACVAIQRLFRGFLARKEYSELRTNLRRQQETAAVTIQISWKRHVHEKRMQERERQALLTTAAWVDDQIKHLNKAVTIIQSCFRRNHDRSEFLERKANIVAVQSLWRRKRALQVVSELRRKRIATDRIVGALRRRAAMCRLRLHVNEMMQLRFRNRINAGSCAVGRLLVQDQFVDAMLTIKSKKEAADRGLGASKQWSFFR